MTTSLSQRHSPTAIQGRRALGRLRGGLIGLVAAGSAAAALLLAPAQAHAQEAAQDDSVKPDGKAIVGGALLGAEVVNLTMGIVGVNRGWPYLVFGGLGAVAGGIGGYFIEQETRNAPEVSLYMLAGGMALVIPTVVISLNATMYKPPEATIDPANAEPAPAPAPMQPGPTQARRPLPRPVAIMKPERLRFSLIDVYQSSLALSVPAVQVRPLYTERERWTYGVQQGSEVRVPVFSASF